MKKINHQTIIKTYLEKTHLVKIKKNTDDLLKNGSLDSFAIVELINFLEKKFCIKILNSELQKNSFFTLKNLTLLINKKTKNRIK